MRIESALEGYWLEKGRNFSKATIDDYALTFRRLIEFLSPKQEFEAITSHQIKLFLTHIQTERQLSQKSLANVWIALSSLWTWAEKELKIEHVIRSKIERPKFRRPVIEPYSQIEVRAMLQACTQTKTWHSRTGRPARSERPTAPRDRAIIITLVDTGLRASELCALKLEDYNSTTGRIFVARGKGNKERVVFASTSARRAIWRYLATRPDAKAREPLFATRRLTHLGRDELRKMIQANAVRGGVAGATVHRFRHTFAINFLRNGGGQLQLQEMLGHEQLETIRIYARLAEVDLSQAQAKASPADNWNL
jgi:integrase/recombinase XerD